MAVLQVSTREFRDRQATILDMADRGVNIVIRRGNKAYAITPISDADLYFTPEILAKIDRSLQEAKEGRVHNFDDIEALDKFIDSHDF